MNQNESLKDFFLDEVLPFFSTPFKKSELGKKLLFSILFFSTIVTLVLTSIQIYVDYRSGINNIYESVDQIKLTQLESLAQNLWNINNEQIQIQLKGLLEIETVHSLTIYPKDNEPISLSKNLDTFREIVTNYPINYQRNGKTINLGTLRIVSEVSPVVKQIESRILIILLAQGAKTFIVSLFILFIFNILVSKHLLAVSKFAKETSLDNIGKKLILSRGLQEKPDELDELAYNLNLMQDKIRREVLQRKGFQDQLLQSQKMEALGTLASGIAHDFNNILQGLYNALFLLEEECIDNADALQRLNTANHLVDRARELVKQILIYTRQKEGVFSQFSPIPPVQDVVEILRAARKNQVTIDLFIEPLNGQIFGDKTQLKQVLLNLGNNSLHALEDVDNPQLKIYIRSSIIGQHNPKNLEPGNYLEIKVHDNGHGMAKETQERIFEPFFTTKDIDKGTGLGLSVVQGIIERHNGMIEVDSKTNIGTTFTLYLPLTKKELQIEAFIYNGDEKIFIISNDHQVEKVLEDTLKELKHDFSTFESAFLALEAIKSFVKNEANKNAIVIIDQYLDEFSSEELVRKIRQFFKVMPIIFLGDDFFDIPLYLRATKVDRSYFTSQPDGHQQNPEELLRFIESAFKAIS